MRKAFIQLHIAVFLAGFTGILGRLITLNEALLVWYRLMITAATLWIIYFVRQNRQHVAIVDIWKLIGVGVVAALHWVTFYGSIKYSNVSVALVCFSSIGFFTAICEPLITGNRLNKMELLLGLIAIAGIAFIFHFDPQYKTGIVLGLVTSLLGAIFPIFNRQLVQRVPPQMVTMYELSGGFLFLCAVVPFYLHYLPADHILPTWSDLGWLLVLCWLCTVLAFNLSMYALKKISAFTVNLTYILEPVYGIALAFLVYREDKMLTSTFYIGMLLILLSVGLQTFLVYRARKKGQP